MARSYDTLQEMIDGGFRLSAHHQRISPLCSHSSELDLVALAARLGPDFCVVTNRDWLLRQFTCKACGEHGKNMSIIINPPQNMGGLAMRPDANAGPDREPR